MDTQTKKQRGRPWLWGTIVVYCLFASGTLGFVFFASSQKVDLVSEDYYKQEIQYQQHIETVKRTVNLDKKIKWNIDGNGTAITFILPVTAQGTITFYRPSTSTLDKTFAILPDAEGKQIIAISSLKSGYWKVKITWQENNNYYYHEGDLTV